MDDGDRASPQKPRLAETWPPYTAHLVCSDGLPFGVVSALPFLSNDLEVELVARGIPPLLLTVFFWSLAHLFDRGATRVHQELKLHEAT